MKFSLHLLICLVLLVAYSGFAQSQKEVGISLYKNGEYKKAINALKQASKADSKDAETWYYLALSQFIENKLNDAEKSFRKSVELNPNDPQSHVGLAYYYLSKNKSADAQSEAKIAVGLNQKEAEIHYHYIFGVVSFRNGTYSTAYERAKKAIELDPNFANAYFLKTESLVSSFIQQAGTVTKPTNDRSELLIEATADLEKYIALSGKISNASFYKEYLESVKFFADYYKQPERNILPNLDIVPQQDSADATALKILSKPRASYSDKARSAGVSGTITLLVGFSSDATIKHILVLKPLGFGLDQEAIKAVKAIKFVPQTKDGKPVSVVKQLQYAFSLY